MRQRYEVAVLGVVMAGCLMAAPSSSRAESGVMVGVDAALEKIDPAAPAGQRTLKISVSVSNPTDSPIALGGGLVTVEYLGTRSYPIVTPVPLPPHSQAMLDSRMVKLSGVQDHGQMLITAAVVKADLTPVGSAGVLIQIETTDLDSGPPLTLMFTGIGETASTQIDSYVINGTITGIMGGVTSLAGTVTHTDTAKSETCSVVPTRDACVLSYAASGGIANFSVKVATPPGATGRHLVTFTVIDGRGGTGASDSVTVTRTTATLTISTNLRTTQTVTTSVFPLAGIVTGIEGDPDPLKALTKFQILVDGTSVNPPGVPKSSGTGTKSVSFSYTISLPEKRSYVVDITAGDLLGHTTTAHGTITRQ